MSWTEASTIQLSLLEWAEEAGWERVCGENRLFPDEGVAHVARRAGASVAG